MSAKEYELSALDSKQSISWKTLEEQNCGNMQNTLKMDDFKTKDCFANISATKASIFMKLQTNIHKTVKNYHKIFRKDPYTNTHTRRKRAIFAKQS